MYILVDILVHARLVSKELSVLLKIGFAKITLIQLFKSSMSLNMASSD